MLRRFFFVLALSVLASGAGAATDPCQADKTDPTIDNTFECLFNIFPRSGGEGTIGYALSQWVAEHGGTGTIKPGGPLIVVNGWGIFIYWGESGQPASLIDYVLTRDQPNTGFTQMTALSHVGPAIAYLAALADFGSSDYPKLRDDLLARIKTARKALLADPGWIAKTTAKDAWGPYAKQIFAMMNYGLWMSEDYLTLVGAGTVPFTQQSVATDFYSGGLEGTDGKKRYAVPFDNVMIGTFMLTDLQSSYDIRTVIARNLDLKLADARVLVHMQIGTNFGAGLTAETNQLVHALQVLTEGAIGDENILIAPYANVDCTRAKAYEDCAVDFYAAPLSAKTFGFLSDTAWWGIYNRTQIAKTAFYNIPGIAMPLRQPIPGDYGFTGADDIGGFMQRLQNSLVNRTELLSNSVGFWMPDEFAAKGFDPAKVDIPGVTTGFPAGVKGYPPVPAD